MNYEIVRACQKDGRLRASFDRLAQQTFGLSFEAWYQNGFWGDAYLPYSAVSGGEVLANVSVNRMDCLLNGEKRRYIQLGTVMTKPEARNQGLIRALMEQIQMDYGACDGMFLWANDSVFQFYPKFGFEAHREYRYHKPFSCTADVSAVPVRMETPEDWRRFLAEKNRRTGSAIPAIDNDGLLLFYVTQSMRENVFELKELDALAVAAVDGDTLTLYEVYAAQPPELDAVCRSFGKQIRRVELAFTPKNTAGFARCEYREADSTFFILGERLRRDMETIQCFPALAHA